MIVVVPRTLEDAVNADVEVKLLRASRTWMFLPPPPVTLARMAGYCVQCGAVARARDACLLPPDRLVCGDCYRRAELAALAPPRPGSLESRAAAIRSVFDRIFPSSLRERK